MDKNECVKKPSVETCKYGHNADAYYAGGNVRLFSKFLLFTRFLKILKIEEKMDENVQTLMEFVVDFNNYNKEEKKYIQNVLIYILEELANGGGNPQQFVNSVNSGKSKLRC